MKMRKSFLLFLILPVCITLLLSRIYYLLTPLLLAFIIDALSSSDISSFRLCFPILLFSSLILALSYPLGSFLLGMFRENLIYSTRMQVVKVFSRGDFSAVSTCGSGNFVSVLDTDIPVFFSFLTERLFQLPFDLAMSFFVIFLFFKISPFFAGLLLSFGIIITILSHVSSRRLREKSHGAQVAKGRLRQFLTETLRGIWVVKAMCAERWRKKGFEKLQERETEKSLERHLFSGFVMLWNHSGARVIALAILLAGGIAMLDGKISLGMLFFYLTVGPLVFSPFYYFISLVRDYRISSGAYRRIFSMLNIPTEFSGSGGWVGGRIEFKDIWFSYGDEWVLKGVSFAVEPGEHVALVGRSGAGKSTLVNLLLRFYEPQRGKIRVGGMDVRDIDLGVLRGRIGMVPQDVFIFSGTLRENILMGMDVDEERLEKVIRMAGIDRILEKLPEGLDSVVGEGGYGLSGGERQRVGIARVLLREPEVVIFDEAMSALDSYSEMKIKEFIEDWGKGRTFVVIAHRWSTVRDFPSVLFLHEGRVIKSTHEELMRIKEYREMFKGEEGK